MTFRISDSLLYGTLYFYPDPVAAADGERAGGSGFLLGWGLEDGTDRCSLWAVTNRHIIDGGSTAIRVNAKAGGVEIIDTVEPEWYFHETADLAVRPIALSDDVHQFNYIANNWLISKEWVEALDIGPGDPCFTVGRFVRNDGRQRNTPTARFGQIAQMNGEPLRAEGLPPQDSVLVECRSIGGFSGSPVFLWLDGQFYRPSIQGKTAPDGTKLFQGVFPQDQWLLGVCWCMIPSWEPVCDEAGQQVPSGWQVPANTGIMGVVPAWHLQQLIESGPAAPRRKEIEAAIARLTADTPPSIIETGGGG